MLKIEIDDQALKSIIPEKIKGENVIKVLFVPDDAIKSEEGDPSEHPVYDGPFSDTALKDIEISTLRKRVANYKTQAETYKGKADDSERRYNVLLHRNVEVRKYNAVLRAENQKLAKELDEAKKDAEMANELTSGIGKAADKLLSEEQEKYARLKKEYDHLRSITDEATLERYLKTKDQADEFEECVRGQLMNLKTIRKHLKLVKATAKTSPEYAQAIKYIESDISNLDKFVEERWGHGEEE